MDGLDPDGLLLEFCSLEELIPDSFLLLFSDLKYFLLYDDLLLDLVLYLLYVSLIQNIIIFQSHICFVTIGKRVSLFHHGRHKEQQ